MEGKSTWKAQSSMSMDNSWAQFAVAVGVLLVFSVL